METKDVVVIRGCVECNIADAPPGSGGRTFEHRLLYRVGETVTLEASEAERLAKAGILVLRG